MFLKSSGMNDTEFEVVSKLAMETLNLPRDGQKMPLDQIGVELDKKKQVAAKAGDRRLRS